MIRRRRGRLSRLAQLQTGSHACATPELTALYQQLMGQFDVAMTLWAYGFLLRGSRLPSVFGRALRAERDLNEQGDYRWRGADAAGVRERAGQWSSGDGTPGSDTYDGASNAAFVPADQDFGGCLELQKTDSSTKLRYMGETPLAAGVLPAGHGAGQGGQRQPCRRSGSRAGPGGAGGATCRRVLPTGPSVTLTSYGEVVEVRAIVGPGNARRRRHGLGNGGALRSFRAGPDRGRMAASCASTTSRSRISPACSCGT